MCCFEMISGLEVNLAKSLVVGLNVKEEEGVVYNIFVGLGR